MQIVNGIAPLTGLEQEIIEARIRRDTAQAELEQLLYEKGRVACSNGGAVIGLSGDGRPRMRTIQECVDMLKADDPQSQISYSYISRLVKSGQIPSLSAGRKSLINFDMLLSHLSGAQNSPPADPEYGKIRKISLR